MTSSFSQNWKILAGVIIAVALLGSALSVSMFIPKAEASHNVAPLCGTVNSAGLLGQVQHWDKIVFKILNDPNAVIDPSYLKTPLDIKVLDDPEEVASLDAKIRDFINTHGIANIPPPVPGTTLTVADQLKIKIVDVEYAIICVV